MAGALPPGDTEADHGLWDQVPLNKAIHDCGGQAAEMEENRPFIPSKCMLSMVMPPGSVQTPVGDGQAQRLLPERRRMPLGWPLGRPLGGWDTAASLSRKEVRLLPWPAAYHLMSRCGSPGLWRDCCPAMRKRSTWRIDSLGWK